MKNIAKTILAAIMVFGMVIVCLQPLTVKAADDDLVKTIEQTIDNDKKELSKLPAILEKAYNKLVSAFKKIGSLGSDVKRVVGLYNSLDEESDDYPEKLEYFFAEYNKLGAVKRKLVDFCTGVLDAKDKLVDKVKHIKNVDLYSVMTLETALGGDVEWYSNNETIAEVYDGMVQPNGIGTTKIIAQNSAGEKETYRIIVKKPVISRNIRISNGRSCTISIPSDVTVNDVVVSSERILAYDLEGNSLEVTALAKGTAYIYVGTQTAKTLKYKIKVS